MRFQILLLAKGQVLAERESSAKNACGPQALVIRLHHHHKVSEWRTVSGGHATSTTQGGNGLCVDEVKDQRFSSSQERTIQGRERNEVETEEEKGLSGTG